MLTEQLIPDDAITVLPNGVIEVREATVILRDGVRDEGFPSSYHRYVLAPGDDLTGKTETIVAIAEVVWTDEIKEDWENRPKPI
jgi:hypothetical protein